MDRLRVGRTMAALAMVLTVAVTLVGGLLHPGYSHVADFISELGAVGAPNALPVSRAGFLPIGILIVGSLVALAPRIPVRGVARLGYWLLVCNGLSYIGAAFLPCDLGCPAAGSDRQGLHNLIGMLGYAASGVGLLMLAGRDTSRASERWVPWALRTAGIFTLAALVTLATPDAEPVRGLVQRIAEGALFGALFLIAWQVAGPAERAR